MKRFERHLTRATWGLLAMYALIACATPWLVPEHAVSQRVGPDHAPWWFGEVSAEQRMQSLEIRLTQLERALARDDAATALSELTGGVAEIPLADVRRAVALARTRWDALPSHSEREAADLAVLDPVADALRPLEPPATRAERFRVGLQRCLGTDGQGRSIALRALVGIHVAVEAGVVVAVLSVLLGTLLGAVAGFYGGWPDHTVTAALTAVSSIPHLVFLMLLVYLFSGGRFDGTVIPTYTALTLTFWVGPCRVVRAWVQSLREREFVLAARVLGLRSPTILVRHVLPNTLHLAPIHLALAFVAAIKAEVVLAFLGLGARLEPSWGRLLRDAADDMLRGSYVQVVTVTLLLTGLLLSMHLVLDRSEGSPL